MLTRVVFDQDAVKEMIKELNYIYSTANNPRKIQREMGTYILGQIEEGFKYMQDPYGRHWDALKKPRENGTTNVLTDTGKLRKSFKVKLETSKVEIGSAVYYASFHQFGVPANNLAPRHMLPLVFIPDTWELELENIAIRNLTNYRNKI